MLGDVCCTDLGHYRVVTLLGTTARKQSGHAQHIHSAFLVFRARRHPKVWGRLGRVAVRLGSSQKCGLKPAGGAASSCPLRSWHERPLTLPPARCIMSLSGMGTHVPFGSPCPASVLDICLPACLSVCITAHGCPVPWCTGLSPAPASAVWLFQVSPLFVYPPALRGLWDLTS